MASAHHSTSSERAADILTCSVCKDTYRDPRLLPCHHTFCLDCVQTLVDHAQPGHRLPCPVCRTAVTLPTGGVPALQSNFYLTPLLEPEMCLKHVGKPLEVYCRKDNAALCIVCALVDHHGHKIMDLGHALLEANSQLTSRLTRSAAEEKYLRSFLKKSENRLEHWRSAVAALKETVLKRTLYLAYIMDDQGDRRLEELVKHSEIQLSALDKFLEDKQASHAQSLDEVELKGETVKHVQKELETVLCDDSCSQEILSLDAEMQRREQKQRNHQPSQQDRRDLMLYFEDYQPGQDIPLPFGYVSPLTGRIQKWFHCVDDPKAYDDFKSNTYKSQAHIHALTFSAGYVFVAYQLGNDRQDEGAVGWISKHTPSGKRRWEPQEVAGRVSLSSLDHGGLVRVEGEYFPAQNLASEFLGQAESSDDKLYDVYSKVSARYLVRVLSASGDCEMRAVRVQGGQTTAKPLFSFTAFNPVAMDANQDGTLFAVVEKDMSCVKVYRYSPQSSSQTNISLQPQAMYTGHGKHFQAHDVCFFFIGRKERLVIADSLNDCLHVLDVSEDCHLIGQVGVDHEDLVQPTALCRHPETEGQLWIGCEGGLMVTLTFF